MAKKAREHENSQEPTSEQTDFQEPEYERQDFNPPEGEGREGEAPEAQDVLPPQTNLGPGGPWLDHEVLPQPGTVEDEPPAGALLAEEPTT